MEEWHFNKDCDENGGICCLVRGCVFIFILYRETFSLYVHLCFIFSLNINTDRAKVTLK